MKRNQYFSLSLSTINANAAFGLHSTFSKPWYIFGNENTTRLELQGLSVEFKLLGSPSDPETQFIFKHSTRCGISRMVMNQFESAYDVDINADLHYLDLLNYRDVSNEVGYKFQVMHQSPQMLVVKNGVVVSHASHGAINEVDLGRFV